MVGLEQGDRRNFKTTKYLNTKDLAPCDNMLQVVIIEYLGKERKQEQYLKIQAFRGWVFAKPVRQES